MRYPIFAAFRRAAHRLKNRGMLVKECRVCPATLVSLHAELDAMLDQPRLPDVRPMPGLLSIDGIQVFEGRNVDYGRFAFEVIV